MKNNSLIKFFIANVIVFNLLFFLKDPLLRAVYRLQDVYSKCPQETLSCDPGSYTIVDDIIVGLFAASLLASAVTAAILLSRQIEKSWNKRSERSQRNKPRPRQPQRHQ